MAPSELKSKSNTFKYPLPETNPIPTSDWDPLDTNGRHLYSRYSQNVTGRVEKILSRVCNGYALTYSSGLSAGFAALTYLQPTSIAITDRYQGMHSSLSVYQRTHGSTSLSICGIDDKFPTILTSFSVTLPLLMALALLKSPEFCLLHTTARAYNLIGPSDSVSNLRPVIYEFTGNAKNYDLQWKIQRQQLETFNHTFWTDSNTCFESAKQAVLASLPEAATPRDKERALSEFYQNWVLQEDRQFRDYSVEWRRCNYQAIMFAAKVQLWDFRARLKNIFTFSK